MSILESYKFAQMMRGQVPEYDETYIEKYLPKDIVIKLWQQEKWIDKDGYTWSFYNVCASKDSQGIYISYAGKYMGQGYSEQKIYRPDLNIHEIKYFG